MPELKVVLCRSGDYDPEPKLVLDLVERFPAVRIIDLKREEFQRRREEVRDAEVFVGWPDDDQLAAMPSLRWLQLPSAGANGYTNRPSLSEQVVVTNSSGVFGIPGAEHAIALMLSFTRQLHVHFEPEKEGLEAQFGMP